MTMRVQITMMTTLAIPLDARDISRAYQDLGWGHGATSRKWWFERPSAGHVVLCFFREVGYDC